MEDFAERHARGFVRFSRVLWPVVAVVFAVQAAFAFTNSQTAFGILCLVVALAASMLALLTYRRPLPDERPRPDADQGR